MGCNTLLLDLSLISKSEFKPIKTNISKKRREVQVDLSSKRSDLKTKAFSCRQQVSAVDRLSHIRLSISCY